MKYELYHGTNYLFDLPDHAAITAGGTREFGPGLYVTPHYDQAKSYAVDKQHQAIERGSHINHYELDIEPHEIIKSTDRFDVEKFDSTARELYPEKMDEIKSVQSLQFDPSVYCSIDALRTHFSDSEISKVLHASGIKAIQENYGRGGFFVVLNPDADLVFKQRETLVEPQQHIYYEIESSSATGKMKLFVGNEHVEIGAEQFHQRAESWRPGLSAAGYKDAFDQCSYLNEGFVHEVQFNFSKDECLPQDSYLTDEQQERIQAVIDAELPADLEINLGSMRHTGQSLSEELYRLTSEEKANLLHKAGFKGMVNLSSCRVSAFSPDDVTIVASHRCHSADATKAPSERDNTHIAGQFNQISAQSQGLDAGVSTKLNIQNSVI